MPQKGSSSLSIISQSFSSRCSTQLPKTEQRERQRQGVDDRDPVRDTVWKWQQAHSRMNTMLIYVCSVPIQSQKEIYHFIHVHGKKFQALPEDIWMKTELTELLRFFISEASTCRKHYHRAVLHLFPHFCANTILHLYCTLLVLLNVWVVQQKFYLAQFILI